MPRHQLFAGVFYGDFGHPGNPAVHFLEQEQVKSHWDNPMNFLLKLFLLFIGIFSLISINATAESFPLKELDCDWDENSVTIPNSLTVKIDNAAIWGYHAYTADLNQDGKPDYLLHQTYTTCGKYAGTAKSCSSCHPSPDTPKRKETLAFSIKDIFLKDQKFFIRRTIYDNCRARRVIRIYPLSKLGICRQTIVPGK